MTATERLYGLTPAQMRRLAAHWREQEPTVLLEAIYGDPLDDDSECEWGDAKRLVESLKAKR
ncbi:MAG: hypothetical protein V3S55_13965 [Nitrospiraceae bacterium]